MNIYLITPDKEKVRVDTEKDVAYLMTESGEKKLPLGSKITAEATLHRNKISKEQYLK